MSIFKRKILDETPDEQLEEFQKLIHKTNVDIEIQEDCDYLLNAYGDFGHTHTNPIPVNGSLGELKYLHRLRCKCNNPLYFHRIGNRTVGWIVGGVDIFETLCYSGEHWDVLYFHMHHPRRSKQIPESYSFSDFHPEFSRIPVVIGANLYVESFPFGLAPFVKRFLGPSLEIFANNILANYEQFLNNNPKAFVRTQLQTIKLKEALVDISGRSSLNFKDEK